MMGPKAQYDLITFTYLFGMVTAHGYPLIHNRRRSRHRMHFTTSYLIHFFIGPQECCQTKIPKDLNFTLLIINGQADVIIGTLIQFSYNCGHYISYLGCDTSTPDH
jgi:hypothetical protein